MNSCVLLSVVVMVILFLFLVQNRENLLPYPVSSGVKFNMSHDLRGDEPIEYIPVGPWNSGVF